MLKWLKGLFSEPGSNVKTDDDPQTDVVTESPVVQEKAPLHILVAAGPDLEVPEGWLTAVREDLQAGLDLLGVAKFVRLTVFEGPIWSADAGDDFDDFDAFCDGVSQRMSEKAAHFALTLMSHPMEDRLEIDFTSSVAKADSIHLLPISRQQIRVPVEPVDRPAFASLVLCAALSALERNNTIAKATLSPSLAKLQTAVDQNVALLEFIDPRMVLWLLANAGGHLANLVQDWGLLEESSAVLASLVEEEYAADDDTVKLRLFIDLAVTQLNLFTAKHDEAHLHAALRSITRAEDRVIDQTHDEDHRRLGWFKFRTLLLLGAQTKDATHLRGSLEAIRGVRGRVRVEDAPLEWLDRSSDEIDALLGLNEVQPSKAHLDRALEIALNGLELDVFETLPSDKFRLLERKAKIHFRRNILKPDLDEVLSEHDAYSAMADLVPKDEAPGTWAQTMVSVGETRLAIFDQNRDLEWLERAIQALQLASTQIKKDPDPLYWARLNTVLGGALHIRGETRQHSADLLAAIRVFSDALDVFTRDAYPEEWGQTHYNLAQARFVLASLMGGTMDLSTAVWNYEQALSVLPRSERPRRWALVTERLASARLLQAEIGQQPKPVEIALRLLDGALEVNIPERDFMNWFFTYRARANGLYLKAAFSNKAEDYRNAIEAFNRLSEQTSDKLTLMDRAMSYLDLARMQIALSEVARAPEQAQAGLDSLEHCRSFFDPVEQIDLDKTISSLEVKAEALIKRLS